MWKRNSQSVFKTFFGFGQKKLNYVNLFEERIKKSRIGPSKSITRQKISVYLYHQPLNMVHVQIKHTCIYISWIMKERLIFLNLFFKYMKNLLGSLQKSTNVKKFREMFLLKKIMNFAWLIFYTDSW